MLGVVPRAAVLPADLEFARARPDAELELLPIGLQHQQVSRKSIAPPEQAGRAIERTSDGHRGRLRHHANHHHHANRPRRGSRRPNWRALRSSHVTRSIRGRRRTSLSRATTARSSFGHYILSTNRHKAIRYTREMRCSYARARHSRLRCIRATRRNCRRCIRASRRTLRHYRSAPSSRLVRMSSYAPRAELCP